MGLLSVIGSALAARSGRVKVRSVRPHLGCYTGGMQVNVSGANFVSYGDVRVRWGGNTWTRATVVSATMITTLSPQNFSHATGVSEVLAPVEVSLNGVTWSVGTTAFFTFYALHTAQVSVLFPGGGPTLGNTRVTVSGRGMRGPGYRPHSGLLPATSASHVGDSGRQRVRTPVQTACCVRQ